jgi:uncharacterized membrane protein YdjX (TVP38/TMEM64 family)
VNLRTAPVADTATARGAGLPRGVLPAARALTVAAFAAVAAGFVQPPDLEAALTDLSDTLGPWTYVLVAALAFLETGAFVGLIAPGETAIVLGGVVAAQGDVNLAVILVLAWLAAALGDLLSFTLGKRLGRRFERERAQRFHLSVSPSEHRDFVVVPGRPDTDCPLCLDGL